MLQKLKALWGERSGADNAAGGHADKLQLATAALLIEAAEMDADFGAEERATITELVERRFGLSAEESRALVRAASDKVQQSVEVFGFTREIKNAFSPEERIEMMEMLWEVAYADGALHDLEANLMRRLAGLLHVSDRDSGLARKRVLTRLGLED
ncbi:TerB family tellurite resistance protein [Pelagibius sp. CAU 1746]|uniref:tellurite resistance TerB family protein n=1 Tax=Pelagibius sp. CAU 1746 TaxID=3140370 RepID=UPI00325BE059